MDSTEFNKIAGASLGALLIFLLLNFFSGQIYGTREAGGHHGEEVLAFALAVETEGAGEGAEEQQVDYAALVAAADPAAGESVFRACSACHKLEEGANAIGPHLYDVVGRDIAAAEGFSYSDALMAAEGDWTLEHLSGFLENPKGWAPGTKMSFAGVKDPQDRVNVIAYLNEVGGSPVDLAAGLEPVAAADAEGGATDAGQAPADGGAAGTTGAMPGAAETSVSEGDDAGGAVTGATVVDNTDEDADVPTSPAAETGEAERTGEDVVHSPDPSPEAPAQQDPGMAGAPGAGAAPQAGSPQAGEPDEAAATPGQEAPAERVEGEDAPPKQPPGQPPQQGATVTGVDPVDVEEEDVEVEAPPAEIEEEADPQSAEALPGALTPGETRADPRAEPPVEAQPEQTPPGAPVADGEGEQLAAAPAAAPAAGGMDFASGDAAAGEKLFRRCAACHKVEEGKNGIGPHLWGVVGRDVAAVEGYSYSDAMQAHEGAWTAEQLSAYLENPKAIVPGTKMAFAGLKDEQDRIDVITYLNEADGSPEPLE